MGLDPANLSGERLDQVGLLGQRHPRRVLVEYVTNFDVARPRQGIGQGVPTCPRPLDRSGAPV